MTDYLTKCNHRILSASNSHHQIKRVPLFYFIELSLVILVAIGLALETANATGPTTVVVKMLDTPPSFDPAQITIHVGDSIKWENVGNSVHHTTDDPAAAIKADDVAKPPGAKPFDSGFILPGANFTQTFTVPGTYKYVCAAHETSGMSGEVVVR
jgi:plastocyanin